MIANMLEGMEHEEAARLAGLSRSAAYSGITAMKRMALRDCVTGRARVDSHGLTPRRVRGSRNGLSLALSWRGTG